MPDPVPSIIIVGLGPGPLTQLTVEAQQALLSAEKVFFRTSAHAAYDWLKTHGKHVACFDKLYESPWENPGDIYDFIVSAILREAELRGSVTYALPGSPVLIEETTRLLQKRCHDANITLTIIHGLSFVEEALAHVNADFADGLQIVLPRTHLETGRFTAKLNLLVCQIEAQRVPTDTPHVELTTEWLLRVYPAEHRVTLIWTDGAPDYGTRSRQFALQALPIEYGHAKFFASLFVPALVTAT